MNIRFKELTKGQLIAEIERVKRLKIERCRPCLAKRRIYMKRLENHLWEKYLKGELNESIK